MLNLIKTPESDYTSLKSNWLKSHLRINIIAGLFVIIAEIVIAFALYVKTEDGVLTSASASYVIWFLLLPVTMHLSVLALQLFFYGSKRFNLITKMYALSIGLSIECFICACVHSYYIVLLTVFVVPIIVTVIYGDEKLTNIIIVVNLVLDLISIFLIDYDRDTVKPWQDTDVLVQYMLSFVLMACVIITCKQILKYEKERVMLAVKVEQQRKTFQEEALTDALTGLYNRTALNDYIKRITEEKGDLSSYIIVMADIDKFKGYNDTFGHVEGDKLLSKLGSILKAHCHGGLAFRYGGDEFCEIFKNTSFSAVEKDCREVTEEIKKWFAEEGKDSSLSVSFGAVDNSEISDFDELIRLADEQLYLSKKSGSGIRIRR